jgi:hypothetical protein
MVVYEQIYQLLPVKANEKERGDWVAGSAFLLERLHTLQVFLLSRPIGTEALHPHLLFRIEDELTVVLFAFFTHPDKDCVLTVRNVTDLFSAITN